VVYVLAERRFLFSARAYDDVLEGVSLFSGLKALYYLPIYVVAYTFFPKQFHTRADHVALFLAITFLSSLLTPFTLYMGNPFTVVVLTVVAYWSYGIGGKYFVREEQV
jgi:hypothetical protein